MSACRCAARVLSCGCCAPLHAPRGALPGPRCAKRRCAPPSRERQRLSRYARHAPGASDRAPGHRLLPDEQGLPEARSAPQIDAANVAHLVQRRSSMSSSFVRGCVVLLVGSLATSGCAATTAAAEGEDGAEGEEEVGVSLDELTARTCVRGAQNCAYQP